MPLLPKMGRFTVPSVRTGLVIFSSLLLSACGGEDLCTNGEPRGENCGLGWTYDVEGPRGLRMRYSSADRLANPAVYERLFEELQSCAAANGLQNLHVPPPLVIFMLGTEVLQLQRELGLPNPINRGLFIYPGAVVIRTPSEHTARGEERFLFQHESAHYVLYMHGDPAQVGHDPVAQHASPIFQACVEGDGDPVPR